MVKCSNPRTALSNLIGEPSLVLDLTEAEKSSVFSNFAIFRWADGLR